MSCGDKKFYTGGPAPLVCNLDAGHELPHGIRDAGGTIYARWPVYLDDEAERKTAAARLIAAELAKKKKQKRGKGA